MCRPVKLKGKGQCYTKWRLHLLKSTAKIWSRPRGYIDYLLNSEHERQREVEEEVVQVRRRAARRVVVGQAPAGSE